MRAHLCAAMCDIWSIDSWKVTIFSSYDSGVEDIYIVGKKFKFTGDVRDIDGNSSLHFAAAENCLDTVKFLVKEGAHINIQNSFLWTPLMQAARYGLSEIVGFLISKGANVHLENIYGMSALTIACIGGHKEVQKILELGSTEEFFLDILGAKINSNTLPYAVLLASGPNGK